MKKFKIISTIVLAILLVSSLGVCVFAGGTPTDTIDGVNGKINTNNVEAGDLQAIAGQILSLIQVASAIATVVLVAIFGFKFIMGSANEKADYQKSFIPLIVGIAVVFAATSIAKLLFTTFVK